MSKPYFCTLRKDTVINGQEVKAKTPLIIRLFDHESPSDYTLNVNHAILRVTFGGIQPIGDIPLKDINQFIDWQVKE